ncbi:MAG: hypothetical protein CFE24_03460 [Flavobacterium sp. BFFFF2]|nr:MAG: hypothetical protein CFE24_03460 [Flavobacterium sp. BFFFF2]
MKTIILGISLLMSVPFYAHTNRQQVDKTNSSITSVLVEKGDNPKATCTAEQETIDQILIDRQITESAEESAAPLRIDYTIWDKMADDQAIVEQASINEVQPLKSNLIKNHLVKHKKHHHLPVKFSKTIKN